MDKYDEEIERLTKNPEAIFDAWCEPTCLFEFVTPNGNKVIRPDGNPCGCLTMVRQGDFAWTDELTAEIQADERLPKTGLMLTVEDLPVFAEWQRKLDKVLNRA